ncbi:MAG: hypothetical protein ABIQ10_02065 [Gemmatimonadaceae bacterium]
MAIKKVSEFERLSIRSAEQVLAVARGELAPARVTVLGRTARDVEIAPPPMFDAARVARVRKSMKVSQAVFADMLNVSAALVKAWEQGARHPDGAPQRLLQIAEQNPTCMNDLVTGRGKRLSAPRVSEGRLKMPVKTGRPRSTTALRKTPKKARTRSR